MGRETDRVVRLAGCRRARRSQDGAPAKQSPAPVPLVGGPVAGWGKGEDVCEENEGWRGCCARPYRVGARLAAALTTRRKSSDKSNDLLSQASKFGASCHSRTDDERRLLVRNRSPLPVRRATLTNEYAPLPICGLPPHVTESRIRLLRSTRTDHAPVGKKYPLERLGARSGSTEKVGMFFRCLRGTLLVHYRG